MRHSHATIAAFVVLAIVAAGCAARSAYSKGDTAARAGDWDVAVEQYRKALQEDPQNVQVQDLLRTGESQRGRHTHRRRETRRSAGTARSGSDGVPSRAASTTLPIEPSQGRCSISNASSGIKSNRVARGRRRSSSVKPPGQGRQRLSSTSTASFSRFASSRPACATSSISSAKRLAST